MEYEWWEDDEFGYLNRRRMLAAEVFGYSYDNYYNHRGNIRFDRYMPEDVDILERAGRDNGNDKQLVQALEIEESRVEEWRRSYREAKHIVDAPTAAEAFRRAVRFSICYAVEEGLNDEGSIERLVTQICYRAADLSFRLKMEDRYLSHYSEDLREESEHDRVYLEERLLRDLGTDSRKATD